MIYFYIRLTQSSDCRITGLRIRQCMGSCGEIHHEPVTFQVSTFCPSAGISQAGICIVQWSIGFLPCHLQPKHTRCCGVWQRAKDWCWASCSCNIAYDIDSHQADTIFWLQNWRATYETLHGDHSESRCDSTCILWACHLSGQHLLALPLCRYILSGYIWFIALPMD